MNHDYGLRWTEFAGREGRLTTKEKFFASAEKRAKFEETKLLERDGFHEIVSRCEPTAPVVGSNI